MSSRASEVKEDSVYVHKHDCDLKMGSEITLSSATRSAGELTWLVKLVWHDEKKEERHTSALSWMEHELGLVLKKEESGMRTIAYRRHW